MKRVFFVGIMCTLSALASTSAFAKTKLYWINVPIYHQETQWFCGPTIVQMWRQFKTGSYRSQWRIAAQTPYSKALIGKGINAGDMKMALEHHAGGRFDYHNHFSKKSARKRIKKELKNQRRPLAIAGRVANGRSGGHWYLINGLKYNKKGSKNGVKGVYMLDPLAGSAWEHNYPGVIHPGQYVSRSTLFRTYWRPLSFGARQSVED